MRLAPFPRILGTFIFAGTIGQLSAPARADESAPAPAPDAPTFPAEVAKHFAEWDRDHDGAITFPELDHAIADAQVKASAAAAAVTLRGAMVRAKVERVTLSDAQKDSPAAERSFSASLKRLQTAPHALYAKDTPHPEGLRQGKLGDCFCLAGLRAVLQRDPAALTTMIQPLADGSYRVRIGATEVPTSAVTDGEILLGANPDDGLWPIVYEKAVGLFRTKPGDLESTPLAVITHGGSAGAMMAKLTAHDITRWSCQAWREAAANPDKQAALLKELRSSLQSAFAEKRLVTTGSGARPTAGGVPGVTYSHGYAVLGYDAAKDEVRLWNPHGDTFTPKGDPGLAHGYPRTRGEWTAPLADAVTFLSGFAFEKLPTVKASPAVP